MPPTIRLMKSAVAARRRGRADAGGGVNTFNYNDFQNVNPHTCLISEGHRGCRMSHDDVAVCLDKPVDAVFSGLATSNATHLPFIPGFISTNNGWMAEQPSLIPENH